MPRTIYKYPIPHNKGLIQQHALPKGAKIVYLGFQGATDHLHLWAEVNTSEPELQARSFAIIGTGETIPDGWEYVATAQEAQQTFVWHLFEKEDA